MEQLQYSVSKIMQQLHNISERLNTLEHTEPYNYQSKLMTNSTYSLDRPPLLPTPEVPLSQNTYAGAYQSDIRQHLLPNPGQWHCGLQEEQNNNFYMPRYDHVRNSFGQVPNTNYGSTFTGRSGGWSERPRDNRKNKVEVRFNEPTVRESLDTDTKMLGKKLFQYLQLKRAVGQWVRIPKPIEKPIEDVFRNICPPMPNEKLKQTLGEIKNEAKFVLRGAVTEHINSQLKRTISELKELNRIHLTESMRTAKEYAIEKFENKMKPHEMDALILEAADYVGLLRVEVVKEIGDKKGESAAIRDVLETRTGSTSGKRPRDAVAYANTAVNSMDPVFTLNDDLEITYETFGTPKRINRNATPPMIAQLYTRENALSPAIVVHCERPDDEELPKDVGLVNGDINDMDNGLEPDSPKFPGTQRQDQTENKELVNNRLNIHVHSDYEGKNQDMNRVDPLIIKQKLGFVGASEQDHQMGAKATHNNQTSDRGPPRKFTFKKYTVPIVHEGTPKSEWLVTLKEPKEILVIADSNFREARLPYAWALHVFPGLNLESAVNLIKRSNLQASSDLKLIIMSVGINNMKCCKKTTNIDLGKLKTVLETTNKSILFNLVSIPDTLNTQESENLLDLNTSARRKFEDRVIEPLDHTKITVLPNDKHKIHYDFNTITKICTLVTDKVFHITSDKAADA